MSQPREFPEEYGRALAGVGAAALTSLQALEACFRRLHPPWIPSLREKLAPADVRLVDALAAFREIEPPEGLAPFHTALGAGAQTAHAALERFLDPETGDDPTAGVLASLSLHARAQEALYPLRLALPPLSRYFAEPACHERLDSLEMAGEASDVGLHRAGDDEGDGRGGFCLYVPEWYTPERSWPLVVALHGGHGHGRDFLWTWLREARSRGCLLLAPTSQGPTWALDRPPDEIPALAGMVEFVCERWNVDRDRVLLTGLSDGATFSLLAGLAEAAPYTHLAPVAGVLHSVSSELGNLERARGRRIYLVHGALDWMFPVASAHMTRDVLRQAGADLSYHELADLSHTYPREENARILEWLDPQLGL